MRTLWNLLEDEPGFPSLEDSGFTLISAEENGCDVIICGLEHVEYAGALVNPQDTFFIVALNDPEHERHLVPNTFSAWINRKRLERLPEMLDAYQSHIDQRNRTRVLKDLMYRFSVDTAVHHANLGWIKQSMRESTKEIETIFEERVEEMRAIHKDAAVALEQLTLFKERVVPEVFDELEESWNMTSSILTRTDEVIKAMFGFIMVLQCEDRITQMIDGIGAIMDNDIASMNENGYDVPLAQEAEYKARLVPFYTIQEQRDYAMGEDNAMQGCKPEQADIDDFTLF